MFSGSSSAIGIHLLGHAESMSSWWGLNDKGSRIKDFWEDSTTTGAG
jgi:hypothetical protein